MKKQKAVAFIILVLLITIPVTSALGSYASSRDNSSLLQATATTSPWSFYAIEYSASTISKQNGETGVGWGNQVNIPATDNGNPIIGWLYKLTRTGTAGTAGCYGYGPYNTTTLPFASISSNGTVYNWQYKSGIDVGEGTALQAWVAANYPSYVMQSGTTAQKDPANWVNHGARWNSGTSTYTYTCTGVLTAIYVNLSPTATPTPFCQDAIGTWKTVDLMATGTKTSGAYTADQALIDNKNYYILDFTLTATVPRTLDGFNAAYLSVGVEDLGTHRISTDPANIIATVNGLPFVGPGDGSMIEIAVGGSTTMTIQYHAEIPGSPSAVDTMTVKTISLRIPIYLDPGMNLLCDGGMEQYPISNYWQIFSGSFNSSGTDFGRLNSVYNSWMENLTNGVAYCSVGMQAVGSYRLDTGKLSYDGAPIMQDFHWSGGNAKWKFRAAAGHLGARAHVWIKDNAGSNVGELFYGDLPGFVTSPKWQLKTGTLVGLDEGDYQFVLEMDSAPGKTVYFDDVAIGSQIDTECQSNMTTLPTMPTPSASPTNKSTATKTPTLPLTPWKSATLAMTGTGTKTATITKTAKATKTATVKPSETLINRTPTRTKTAYGTPQASSTPQPGETQTPWSWQGGDPPPGGDEPGDGACTQPSNAWSLSWWLDYEVCKVLYAFSWQPAHSATMVSVPGIMGTSEPFNSISQMQAGIDEMTTAVATYVYNATPFVNAAGPQTPSPNIFNPGGIWTGAQPFTIPTHPPATPPFSRYCTTRLTEVLGTLMAPGFCYVLNMLRDLGLLIWFQFLIDFLAAMTVVKSLLTTIQFYPLLYNGGRKESEE